MQGTKILFYNVKTGVFIINWNIVKLILMKLIGIVQSEPIFKGKHIDPFTLLKDTQSLM